MFTQKRAFWLTEFFTETFQKNVGNQLVSLRMDKTLSLDKVKLIPCFTWWRLQSEDSM